MARNQHLTRRDVSCRVRVGRLHSVTLSVLDSAPDLDYDETMRHAYAPAERDACDWPELRREILRGGGIGPSPDWDNDTWPGDLFRAHGKAPDLVAVETTLGRADVPPWGIADGRGANDDDMRAYLWRSWEGWQRAQAAERDAREAKRKPAPVAPAVRKPGTRSYAELVSDLRAKHGAAVDLSGLRSEYVHAYESGERVTVERDGREYRGTVGATRGPRPRFVLLLSLDL